MGNDATGFGGTGLMKPESWIALALTIAILLASIPARRSAYALDKQSLTARRNNERLSEWLLPTEAPAICECASNSTMSRNRCTHSPFKKPDSHVTSKN